MGNKILVADDSKLITSLVKGIFENQLEDNYSVITVFDGKQAIDAAIEHQPDIILMDWQMPVINGIDALIELKKNTKTSGIPVIMLTGSDDITLAFENGAVDFIRKPFDKPELISRVKSSLAVVNAKIEIKQRTIEIDIQRDKLKMQKEILTKQKKELSDSILIVEKMQYSLNPSFENIRNVVTNYFILEMPKEKLKKHFFWFYTNNNNFYFSIGSINRQGLSVSILNMFCVTILNEIIAFTNEADLVPSKIIDVVKNRFKTLLCINETTDCLNLIVGCFNSTDKTVQYSGVNLPMYVIKNNKITELKVENNKMGLLNSDKASVNHKVQLASNDLIYLINNGFNENIGNEYISSEMSKIFIEMHKKPLDKQKRILEKTFQAWKEELRQIDDIFVLGFKIAE